ncbi:hypothetical protein E2C06_05985 [Dankookia rubra]|uniref:Outer membrane protein assembly factor BamE n=1 Tax=Dankookia rubra TaxID=1442381 RepID=A0A4R5QJN5_9PROT|nr:hypothetical protein [Dankookia rubra]TDH63386.1 hypothetical protein E2C06_05985 [Dankookia rubra]
MAPRLRLLLMLLPAGCAAAGDREAVAMRTAMESGQASLVAMGPPVPMAAAVVRVGTAAQPVFQPGFERPEFRHALSGGPASGHPASASELLGAGPGALRRWLGEPTLRRPEGNSEVWLYAGTGCALDLVLYPAAHGLSVAHAAARAQGAEKRTEAGCLGEIAGARQARPIPATTGPAAPPADPGV